MASQVARLRPLVSDRWPVVRRPGTGALPEPTFSSPSPAFAGRLASATERAARFAVRRRANALALAGVETLALVAALLLAGTLRWTLLGEGMVQGWAWIVLPLHLAAAGVAGLLPGWGLGAVEELRRTTLVLAATFALAVVALWLAGTNVEPSGGSSRLTVGLGGLLSLGLVPYARAQAKAWLIRRERWGVGAAVYGAGRAGALVVRQLQEEQGMGYTPVAVFDDDPDRWGEHLDAVPILGPTHLVVDEAAVAVLAMPEHAAARQIGLLEGPLTAYPTVIVVPDLFEAPSLWVKPRDLAGIVGLEITSALSSPTARALKRAVDLALVLLVLPLWGPLVGALALAVWLGDRHAPFYGQERIGQHGERFRAWKLRTMAPDADAALQRALAASPALRAEWDATFKLERDPRVTRAGRWLRRFSLDELPQLWNVLRGEMSLVGPRPLPRYHHDELDARVRDLRARVRPGLTGLWQVSGRSDIGTLGMERWDPYYVRNWSLWLDAVVLVRTARVVLERSGAY